jgi:SAM-dependent methyltransferase
VTTARQREVRWDVESYGRGRPDYPREAIDLLISRMALEPSATVLDLGAGNGRLTRALVEHFEHVIAVEPHTGMREALETAAPQAEVLAGVAEAIPLTSESVDAVFVATAFHWFDPARALPEVARILRPRGALGIVWSKWVRDTPPWAAEVDRVLSRHGTYPGAGWKRPFATTELFEPLDAAVVTAEDDQDRDGVLARVASISFIAALPEDERRAVREEVGAILDRHDIGAPTGRVRMTHRIELAWTRKI